MATSVALIYLGSGFSLSSDPLTVIRNGVQTTIPGDEAAELVKAASVQVALWTPEDLEDHSETDTPWPTWAEADATRAYRSPYVDDAAWPASVPRNVWGALVHGWSEVGWADQVLDVLTGAEVELTEAEKWVVQAMEDLADRLAGEKDGACLDGGGSPGTAGARPRCPRQGRRRPDAPGRTVRSVRLVPGH